MVAKWIRTGKLHAVTTEGKIRFEEAVAQLQAQGLGKFKDPATAPATTVLNSELTDANIRIAKAKASMMERDEQEQRLDLHRTEDIISAFEPLVTATIARLDALPDILVPQLPGDPTQNRQIIVDALNEARKEIAEMTVSAVVKARKKRGGKIAQGAEAKFE